MTLYFSGGPRDGAIVENGTLPPPKSQQLRNPTNWNEKTTYVLSQEEGNDALYFAADDAPHISAIKAAGE